MENAKKMAGMMAEPRFRLIYFPHLPVDGIVRCLLLLFHAVSCWLTLVKYLL